MFRKLLLVFTLLVLFTPKASGAVSKTLLLTSFKVAGEKSTDEFIELSNVSAAKINIAGWQLAKKTASGTKYNLVTSFASVEILPGESIVVGHRDSTENPDIFYTTNYSIAEDNTILIFSDAGKTLVDKVGFGKASDFEGKPLPEAGTDIWARINNVDTDNNLSDFQKISGDSAASDLSGICIAEIMPDPGSGGEEWIEIYNSEITKDISGLVISDKLGSVKKFTVPAGTIIEEGKYLVFYARDTGISLNNDGDGTQLLDKSGNIIDDSGESYGKTTSGLSWAYDGEKWQWSKTPTPGAKNIITIASETDKSVTSKKRTSKSASNTKSKKGKAPKAEVLGSTDQGGGEDDIFQTGEGTLSDSDRLFGQLLIAVALFGGLAYTIYINREKLGEVFKREREGYAKTWEKVREKVKGWRGFSFVRRIRRR